MNVRSLSSSLHLLLWGVQVPICDIVVNGVVEQDHVLWDDANCAPQALQSHILYALSIQQDVALVRLIETVQQPHDSALSATATPHDGTAGPSWNVQGNALQHGGCGPEAKVHILEVHLIPIRTGWQRLCMGRVRHAGMHLQQCKQRAHVHQRLLGLPVHGAKEVEGHGQLEKQAIDHDQVTHAGLASIHRIRGCQHGNGHCSCEDPGLAQVQEGKGLRGLDGAGLVALHACVIALGLVLLIAKILDCLVIDE
mmetsp:Transcript_12039/g.32913  ORF Transcript_12039/g.32913 Transcript_12039/m.32913 type:complete len:253 (-) Transcript_12039:711-1469(-)